MNMKENAEADTPKPSASWVAKTLDQKFEMIDNICGDFADKLHVADVQDSGQVIVSLKEAATPADRGDLLMDFEEHLKANVDGALNVWLEPLGDRNSLRNLRGIEVKK